MHEPLDLQGRPRTVTVTVTVSIGAAWQPAGAAPPDVQSLLVCADGAMYQAKRSGKNACVVAQAG